MKKPHHTTYLEPFLGSAATFVKIAPHFTTSIGTDIHPDLILMWQALCNGWIPPDTISREEYQALKKAEPSALRGMVGFGSSFRGKWFGGYDPMDRVNGTWKSSTWKGSAVKKSLSLVPYLRKATITCMDYRQHTPDKNTIVYADPPYRDTTQYSNSFDSDIFWNTMDKWAKRGTTVIVSEQVAPSHCSSSST